MYGTESLERNHAPPSVGGVVSDFTGEQQASGRAGNSVPQIRGRLPRPQRNQVSPSPLPLPPDARRIAKQSHDTVRRGGTFVLIAFDRWGYGSSTRNRPSLGNPNIISLSTPLSTQMLPLEDPCNGTVRVVSQQTLVRVQPRHLTCVPKPVVFPVPDTVSYNIGAENHREVLNLCFIFD